MVGENVLWWELVEFPGLPTPATATAGANRATAHCTLIATLNTYVGTAH